LTADFAITFQAKLPNRETEFYDFVELDCRKV